MKVLNALLVPVYVTGFLLVWTGAVALFECIFDVSLDTSVTSYSIVLNQYVYPAMHGVSMLPLVGTMFDILMYVMLFELAMWVMKLIFRVLMMFNVVNAVPVD